MTLISADERRVLRVKWVPFRYSGKRKGQYSICGDETFLEMRF